MYSSITNSNGRTKGDRRGIAGSTVAKNSGLAFGSPDSNIVVSFMLFVVVLSVVMMLLWLWIFGLVGSDFWRLMVPQHSSHSSVE